MSDTLWDLKNVSVRGEHRNRLDDITLRIPAGTTAIVGYSGAGKTTLLNVLAGMETADSGSVRSNSFATGKESPFPLTVFWAPQDGGLWPHLTAIEHISAVQARKTGASTGNPSNSADNWLAQFDLNDRQQAFPYELSKGEQSRLAIARVLAANPGVLLMDEPLAHVDPMRKPKYWRIIREHLQRTGASLIFSTHEPASAIRESQFVICLNSGRVVYAGSTQQLYRNPPHPEAAQFLGAINWFSADEVRTWLPDEREETGLRPENIQLRPDEEGILQILSFQFSGSYAETTLKHLTTHAEKTFIHRPSGHAFRDGQRVRIEVIP